MIERLQIKNFQTHTRMDVVFDKGVNSIVGPSDSGKSAILRALLWVLFNTPSGDTFRTHDTKKTAVQVTIDGKTIKRVRSNTLNTYKFNKKVLKAMRTAVPEEIERLLNLGIVNYQAQHDAAFWFCETAGEVSRQLNQIVNLDIIDKHITYLHSNQRDANACLRIFQNTKKELVEELEEFGFVNKQKKDLDKLNKLVEKWSRQVKKEQELRTTYKQAQSLKISIEYNTEKLLYYEEASNTLNTIVQLEEEVEQLKMIILTAETQNTILNKKPPKWKPVQQAYDKWLEIWIKYQEFCALVKELETQEDNICVLKKKLTKQRKRLKSEFQEKCPLCGNPLKKKS